MSAVTLVRTLCNGHLNLPVDNKPPSMNLKGKGLYANIPWWKDTRNIQAVQHYARLKGLLYRSENNSAVNPPLTLQPYNYPQELYEEIRALQPAVNSLVDAVSRDMEFLEEVLARYSTALHDALSLYVYSIVVSTNVMIFTDSISQT